MIPCKNSNRQTNLNMKYLFATLFSLAQYTLIIPRIVSFPTTLTTIKIKDNHPFPMTQVQYPSSLPNANTSKLVNTNNKPSHNQSQATNFSQAPFLSTYGNLKKEADIVTSLTTTFKPITAVFSTTVRPLHQKMRPNFENMHTSLQNDRKITKYRLQNKTITQPSLSMTISLDREHAQVRHKVQVNDTKMNKNQFVNIRITQPSTSTVLPYDQQYTTNEPKTIKKALINNNINVATRHTQWTLASRVKTPSSIYNLQEQILAVSSQSSVLNTLLKPRAIASMKRRHRVNQIDNVKVLIKNKRHGKRTHNGSRALGCGNFVCLLEKYELLKTYKNGEPDGYFLETHKLKLSKKDKKCKSFRCWIKSFRIIKNTDGYLLKPKKLTHPVPTQPLPTHPHTEALNSSKDITIDDKSNNDWDFHRPLDILDIFESAKMHSSDKIEDETKSTMVFNRSIELSTKSL